MLEKIILIAVVLGIGAGLLFLINPVSRLSLNPPLNSGGLSAAGGGLSFPKSTPVLPESGETKITSSPFSNAFLPEPHRSIFDEESQEPSKLSPPEDLARPLTTPLRDFSKNISGINGSATVPKPRPQLPRDILDLPVVADSELHIDQSGPKSVIEYFTYLAKHYREMDFSYSKLNEVVTDKNGLRLSPFEIVKANLDYPSSPQVSKSLEIFEEFLVSKIAFEKSVGATGQAIAVNKDIIALDMLSVKLINMFYDFRDGRLSRAMLEDFLRKYERTGNFYASQFMAKGSNDLSGSSGNNFLANIFRFLEVNNVARAQEDTLTLVKPFGGKIELWSPCTCVATFGQAIVVGPPSPGTFFVPPTATMYPFLFKALVPTACILGIAAPEVPIPCLQQILAVCSPLPNFPPEPSPSVIMAGTSQPGCPLP